MEFWIDFKGSKLIEADSIEDAKEKAYQVLIDELDIDLVEIIEIEEL